MTRPWPIIVAGALLAPLVTWLPMLAAKYPGLGLPLYPPAPQGVDLWQMQAFYLTALGVLAALVITRDRYLGVFLLVAALLVFLRGATMDPTHTVFLALGAVLLVAVRQVPARYDQRIRWALVAAASLQAAYMLQQRLGYDLLWGPLLGGVLNERVQMLGTLGSVNVAAGYIAVVIPLMPLALAIPAAIIVILSHSLGAVAAMVVGLAMCFRSRVVTWIAAAMGLAAAAMVLHKATHGARFMIWSFALEHWQSSHMALGWGLGGWAQRVPALQHTHAFSPTGEIWAEAHNEPLQWLLETGIVGAVLLACWLWAHRGMFTDPVWGPSVAALAVNALGWHPFHIVSTALLGLIVVGLASRPYQEEPTCAAA